MITPLIKCGVPITVFKDRDRAICGNLVEQVEDENLHYVYQNKRSHNFYGTFHSRLILYEFDDRLRVIVSSCNLCRIDWELMSQVIWFQDFFIRDPEDTLQTEF